MDIYTNDLLTCNFCGKRDVCFPSSAINLCARCLKGGFWWEHRGVRIYRSGTCDVCGVYATGAVARIPYARACWRCLWSKLSKKKGALRVAGARLV